MFYNNMLFLNDFKSNFEQLMLQNTFFKLVIMVSLRLPRLEWLIHNMTIRLSDGLLNNQKKTSIEVACLWHVSQVVSPTLY